MGCHITGRALGRADAERQFESGPVEPQDAVALRHREPRNVDKSARRHRDGMFGQKRYTALDGLKLRHTFQDKRSLCCVRARSPQR
jgi:hypothetical protein